MPDNHYDLIIVGTGFAGSFFLLEYLRHAPRSARILVLERGKKLSHVEQGGVKGISPHLIQNRNEKKPWIFSIGFGGGSACWWACTPRMLPEDFRLQSTHGIGVDWPISYEELESYYTEAEEIMAIAGDQTSTPFPMSKPYPQPPHRLSDPDRLLKKQYPDRFFPQPTARPTLDTKNRPRCCNNGVCRFCPIDSKFTILNELSYLYNDPRVTLKIESRADTVETQNGVARGVRFTKSGREEFVSGDFVVLAANAIFNPHILARSDLTHSQLGVGLVEQVSKNVIVLLDGLKNFQGSTSITGHGYMDYSGSHRTHRAASLIETFNIPRLRMTRGKWRQILKMKFIFEDLRQDQNRVVFNPKTPDIPEIHYQGHSTYTQKGLDSLRQTSETILKHLPVERFNISPINKTENHIIGTVTMGNSPETSIVDKKMIHNKVRNLAVIGASSFPTAAPANPTLTITALSLWAARQIFGN